MHREDQLNQSLKPFLKPACRTAGYNSIDTSSLGSPQAELADENTDCPEEHDSLQQTGPQELSRRHSRNHEYSTQGTAARSVFIRAVSITLAIILFLIAAPLYVYTTVVPDGAEKSDLAILGDAFSIIFSIFRELIAAEITKFSIDLTAMSFGSIAAGIGLFAVSGWAQDMKTISEEEAEATRQFEVEHITYWIYVSGICFNLIIAITGNVVNPPSIITTFTAAASVAALSVMCPVTLRRQAAQKHRKYLFEEFVSLSLSALQDIRSRSKHPDKLPVILGRAELARAAMAQKEAPLHRQMRKGSTLISDLVVGLAFSATTIVTAVIFASLDSGSGFTLRESWPELGLLVIPTLLLALIVSQIVYVLRLVARICANNPQKKGSVTTGRVAVLFIMLGILILKMVGTVVDDSFPWYLAITLPIGAFAGAFAFRVRRNATDVCSAEYYNTIHEVLLAADRYGQRLGEAPPIEKDETPRSDT